MFPRWVLSGRARKIGSLVDMQVTSSVDIGVSSLICPSCWTPSSLCFVVGVFLGKINRAFFVSLVRFFLSATF
ncbi:unnamed protein product [Caenorhabditis nigoni]